MMARGIEFKSSAIAARARGVLQCTCTLCTLLEDEPRAEIIRSRSKGTIQRLLLVERQAQHGKTRLKLTLIVNVNTAGK